VIGGDINVDGRVVDRGMVEQHAAYMPQHDVLWPALTVYESLQYSALLYGFQGDSVGEMCESVLLDLGLCSCRDVKVGSIFIKGISGGQKRRLSLGCELVNPQTTMLFCDEPTSGLDAASASEIMAVITRMAHSRLKIVVASIHQPSSQVFYNFDRLLILSGGCTAYFGRAEEALDYFAALGLTMPRAMNPADYLLEIVNGDFNDKDSVQELLEAWEAAPGDPIDTDRSNESEVLLFAGSSRCSLHRVRWLVWRAVACYCRDPGLYLLRFALYLFMSIFLGLTYMEVSRDQADIDDLFFNIIWAVAFFSYMGMIALPAFMDEREVICKEIANGTYLLGEYVISTAAVQLPVVFCCACIASIGPYWICNSGINPSLTAYFEFLTVFAMHLFVVESLAIFVASMIPYLVISLVVFNAVLSQFFVFNGFFISVGNMPVFLVWIYYLSPFSYTTQALMKIVFGGQKMHGYPQCIAKQGTHEQYPCYGATGEAVLEAISDSHQKYNDVNPWAWFGVLVGFAFFFRFLFWFCLRRYVY